MAAPRPVQAKTSARSLSSDMVTSVTRFTLSTLLAMTVFFGTFSRAEQTDLDAFMRQVLASRDANWKKLQQYVLDERELIESARPGAHPALG